MFRLTRYLQALARPERRAERPRADTLTGPVVIWNLTRRCNLTCRHCYATSVDRDFPGELSTREVYSVMDDLRAFGVPVLILSGGEPLMRRDIFDISRHAKATGFYVGLSTNGTLITEDNMTTSVSASTACARLMTGFAAGRAPSTRPCLVSVCAAMPASRWACVSR